MLLLISVNWCKILLHASLQLNYLMTDNINVSGSGEFFLLPETCAPNDTPRLRQYCLQIKVREADGLNHLLLVEIYDGLTTYYSDRPPVTNSDLCQWLQINSISTVEARGCQSDS